MKMNFKLLVGVSLLIASTAAQAVTCSGECRISYENIVSRLSPNANMNQVQDFNVNCNQYHRGYVRQSPPSYEYLCSVRGEQRTSATGQGADLFQARTAARSHCSQQASASGYSYAAGSIYGNMNCN